MAQVFKSTGDELARFVSTTEAFDSEADKVHARVRSEAAKISETGEYLDSIGIDAFPGRKGVIDRVIYSDDDGALAIEFGRKTKDGGFEPGKHVFAKAMWN
ncbi:DUF5403 family protein [Rothia sp. SD9660Na]|uniref:DUF5403 family protein n=1 Tax=Rothia sp. SD9660Na TaxID=3047030 RepID=UPI0024BA6992|nr:DUF5403 family protein [Rothia sp. SD9660Na]WHS51388.1 DUF5403 family protein [Rothia sp. SD9660Na]